MELENLLNVRISAEYIERYVSVLLTITFAEHVQLRVIIPYRFNIVLSLDAKTLKSNWLPFERGSRSLFGPDPL